jgi:ABC-type multidrug transport system ATPase subunit
MAGRLAPFIELGVGFNVELTAGENVVLNGVMMGLTPQETRNRLGAVIEFAELEEFVDLKLKNYSSGMLVRLAFSLMLEVDADILLIDEVLAVGDAAFQQKCFDVFHRMRDERRTILFVTHDMGAVRKFCHRALLFERGVVRLIGEPDEVASNYLELNFGREGGREEDTGEERYGDQSAEIVDAWFEDEHGERQKALSQRKPFRFCARVAFNQEAVNPAFAVVIENEAKLPLFATSTDWVGYATGHYRRGDEAVFSVSLENQFAPGRVYASPWVTRREQDLMDRRPRFTSVVVTGMHRSGGLVDLPHDVSLESGGRTLTAHSVAELP